MASGPRRSTMSTIGKCSRTFAALSGEGHVHRRQFSEVATVGERDSVQGSGEAFLEVDRRDSKRADAASRAQ
jgi:hypothetical protein